MGDYKFEKGDVAIVIDKCDKEPCEIGDILVIAENDDVPFVRLLGNGKLTCLIDDNLEHYSYEPEFGYPIGFKLRCVKEDIETGFFENEIYEVVGCDMSPEVGKLYSLKNENGDLKYSINRFVPAVLDYTSLSDVPDVPKEDVNDMVHEPTHYTSGGIETIDYIKAKLTLEQYEGFLLGNVLKYTSRAGKKDEKKQDLEKASVYLGWLVDEQKEEV